MTLPTSRYVSRASPPPREMVSSKKRRTKRTSSDSEYARTEVIPISRQQRAMRTAISPRLGMINLLTISVIPCPRRLLFLQKRLHPLLSFFRHAPRGDRFDRVRDR